MNDVVHINVIIYDDIHLIHNCDLFRFIRDPALVLQQRERLGLFSLHGLE